MEHEQYQSAFFTTARNEAGYHPMKYGQKRNDPHEVAWRRNRHTSSFKSTCQTRKWTRKRTTKYELPLCILRIAKSPGTKLSAWTSHIVSQLQSARSQIQILLVGVKRGQPREYNEWQTALCILRARQRMVGSSTRIFNTLRPRQMDAISQTTFSNAFSWMKMFKISLKFVPNGPINNIPAMVQIMACRRPGDKPLSEPMVVSLPTHICVTRPQWVSWDW